MAGRTFPPPIKTLALLCVPLLLCGCGGDDTGNAPAPRPSASPTAVPQPKPNSAPSTPQQSPPRHSTPTPSTPQQIYRPDDIRPKHDDARLKELGIHRYESQRLVLYTDIAPEIAQPLPVLMDDAYRAWEEYFGPLPPNRAGTDYQMTGYLIGNKRLFLETGLLPEDLPDFPHGRHRGAEFWMNDQEHDFYRRHLMIHEGTHCFMTTMPNVLAPSSYMEGMAELFGTHHTDADGRTTFRIMPAQSLEVPGWGRLQIIANEYAAGRPQTLAEILNYGHNAFIKTESYAWSWAMCKFLDMHPRYRDRFRELGGYLQGTQFAGKFREFYGQDLQQMNVEWALYSSELSYGYDIERATIDFVPTAPISPGSTHEVNIQADRGWQSTGLEVTAGNTYEIAAKGTVTLAQTPRPWESTPAGITIRYYGGRPLGQLLAVVAPETEPTFTVDAPEPVGTAITLRAKQSGTLFLRVNDAWSELSDNAGAYRVRITQSGNGT